MNPLQPASESLQLFSVLLFETVDSCHLWSLLYMLPMLLILIW